LSSEQEAKIDLLATKAKQDLLLAELQNKADLGETQPVSVSTLPLPTGASTSANQTNGTQKTQVVDSDGTAVDVFELGTQVQSTDKGLVAHAVIHGKTTAGGGSYVDVKVSPSGAMSTDGVINGLTDGGTSKQIGSDENGNLKIAIESPKTAFSEISVANPHPVSQISFEYGVNTQIMTTSVTGTGTVTTANSLLSVSTGASASSSAQLISRRYLKYRAGQGALGRGTMLFTAGVANSKQYAGVGNASLTDGFFFGYNGTQFGIFHINNGSETFTAQSSWNVDTMDGSANISNPSGQNLIPTNGNVWQIKYQYLGFGCIYFYVEHAEDGEFALVHIIKYPNSNITTSLANPSLNLVWRVVNTSNTSNIVLKAGSGALFLEGTRHFLGPKNGIDNNKSNITTLTNILTIKNATTYNTVTNRAQVRIKTISVAYDGGNGVATLQVILGATLGGTPSYTTINGTTGDNGATITNGQSVVSYDTAGTTITGGTVIFNRTLSRNNSADLDLESLDIFCGPSETLTFAVKTTAAGVCSVAVNWIEDL
jgi:hypothetical protein